MAHRPTQRAVRDLHDEIRACRSCAPALDHEPRPILQIDPRARILIAGQAPGRRAHEAGVPFDDPSGDLLRDWMGVTRDLFYDATRVAIVPMGFCYPGTGRSGDLPPRPECAPQWRARVLHALPRVELTLVVGRYAMTEHLGLAGRASLTDAVRNWRAHWPERLPLPHPSPRNRPWLAKNPWFEAEVVPALRKRIGALLAER